MKPKQLRENTLQELEQKLHSLREELFKLRYRAKTGRLEKPSQMRQAKRNIARIITIVKEKETSKATEKEPKATE